VVASVCTMNSQHKISIIDSCESFMRLVHCQHKLILISFKIYLKKKLSCKNRRRAQAPWYFCKLSEKRERSEVPSVWTTPPRLQTLPLTIFMNKLQELFTRTCDLHESKLPRSHGLRNNISNGRSGYRLMDFVGHSSSFRSPEEAYAW